MNRLSPLPVVTLALILSGCSSGALKKLPTEDDLPTVPTVANVKPVTKDSAVTERVGQAAISPLGDLNVVQEEIPDVLQRARDGGPYAVPNPATCEAVQAEIDLLDEALGADFDSPKGSKKASLLERGTDMAEDTGVGMVRRTVEGFVPFRSWVRKLSGAERHSKKVAASITAGGVRRAYLKGWRQATSCPQQAPTILPASAVASASEVVTTTGGLPGVAPAAPAPTPAASAASAP